MTRIHFFIGKGGVGKSTASFSFSAALANQKQKVWHIELGERSVLPALFGGPNLEYKPKKLTESLWGSKLTGSESLKEYLMRQIRIERLYHLFFENRPIRYFFDVAPAIKDLMILGKIVHEADQETYDHIVIDAPATGHALFLFNSPLVVRTLSKFGPVFEKAQHILNVLQSKNTSVYVVTTARPVVLGETLELIQTLKESKLKLKNLMVNRVLPPTENKAEANDVVTKMWAQRAKSENREMRRLKRLSKASITLLPEHGELKTIQDFAEWSLKEWLDA